MKGVVKYLTDCRIFSGGCGFGPGENFPNRRTCSLQPPAFSLQPSLSRRAGVTLIELMIAVAVVTIGVMGSMGAFKYINQAITQSRLKTIASNLAQERMEVLKNKSYYRLLVTTYPATSSGYDPNFVYDNGNYPAEVITIWGFPPLTRAVNVDYASVSGGGVSIVPYSSNDTGLKKITVYIFWTERGTKKKVQLDSYYENPSVTTLSTGFNGQVTVSTGGALAGALVQVSGSPRWRGYSNSAGNYSFQVAPGTYSLVCSSAGFFSQSTIPLLVSEGSYTTQPFSLIRIATGTVGSASVYITNPGLVISQVVASTVQADGFDIQYVELFNPTTAAITIAASAGPVSAHSIKLNILSTCGTSRTCQDVNLNYVNTTVAPGGYYLIANRASFTVLGTNYTADAYYTDTANLPCSPDPPGSDWSAPSIKRIIPTAHNGVVWLTDTAGNKLDAVGWNHGATNPTTCETSCVPLAGQGFFQGDQIVRFSSACAVGIVYGRAYDTNNNSNDFYYNNTVSGVGIQYKPFSASNPAQAVISGRPSTGAYVFADDGNSPAAQSSNSSVTGPQGQVCVTSSFTLVNVATGTWKVNVMTVSSSQTISNVVVAQGLLTGIPNGSTSPSWQPASFNNTALNSAYTGGFASGLVYGAGPNYSTRLSGILMGSSSGGNSVRTDSQGFYVLNLTTGTTVVTANYNSDNGNYTASDAVATIAAGAVTPILPFHLAQGGFIKGYVTPGTGALPNIPVLATLGSAVYEDTTDNTGYFYIFAATAAAAYTITPVLDPLQSYTSLPSTPLMSSVTVPGNTVFAGTITVVGALGTITGSVKSNGSAITTGVLVVASTVAVPNPLSPVYASSAPAQAIFYSASSKSDGTYSLEVRASTSATYNVRFFYPMVDINTGVAASPTPSKLRTGVSVSAAAETPNLDFTWP